MRQWLSALVTALVTTGVGISVNVATDLGSNWWAWAAVGGCTLAAAGVAWWTQRPAPAGGGQTAIASDHATIQQAGRDIIQGPR
ncbi:MULTISPECIES: hypothetical protein [unclassified Crossiella]|uniref:hypothetical protein n=1 Tax=unclassified Crossiella TaxID=2620835 RepID=UPI001FFFC22A|nr:MULTISPECIES: hypothetical protein [unclassified Crossiella]MCK2241634.1 hypothetical protein [Crossiella sp. S99.2]MCK2255494.1 hypothetical protein [Crossiella sp. S99.1]